MSARGPCWRAMGSAFSRKVPHGALAFSRKVPHGAGEFAECGRFDVEERVKSEGLTHHLTEKGKAVPNGGEMTFVFSLIFLISFSF